MEILSEDKFCTFSMGRKMDGYITDDFVCKKCEDEKDLLSKNKDLKLISSVEYIYQNKQKKNFSFFGKILPIGELNMINSNKMLNEYLIKNILFINIPIYEAPGIFSCSGIIHKTEKVRAINSLEELISKVSITEGLILSILKSLLDQLLTLQKNFDFIHSKINDSLSFDLKDHKLSSKLVSDMKRLPSTQITVILKNLGDSSLTYRKERYYSSLISTENDFLKLLGINYTDNFVKILKQDNYEEILNLRKNGFPIFPFIDTYFYIIELFSKKEFFEKIEKSEKLKSIWDIIWRSNVGKVNKSILNIQNRDYSSFILGLTLRKNITEDLLQFLIS